MPDHYRTLKPQPIPEPSKARRGRVFGVCLFIIVGLLAVAIGLAVKGVGQ